MSTHAWRSLVVTGFLAAVAPSLAAQGDRGERGERGERPERVQPQTPKMEDRLQVRKASELIGAKIHDGAGAEIGKVRDLVLDFRSGKVRYAVVKEGERLQGMPVDDLTIDAATGNIQFDERAMRGRSEAVDMDKLPSALTWQRFEDSGPLAENPLVMKVSRVLEMPIENWSGKRLGTFADLVISLRGGNVRYAALKGGEDSFVAVPVTRFRLNPERKLLIAAVDVEELEKSRTFASNEWPMFSGDNWTQFGGSASDEDAASADATDDQGGKRKKNKDTDDGDEGRKRKDKDREKGKKSED